MSNQNNVKQTKADESSVINLEDAYREVLYAASRKSANGTKITVAQSVSVLKKYYAGLNPLLPINDPIPGQAGWTILYMAAYFGSVKECEELLKMGANPSAVAPKGNSLLHVAAARNYALLCDVLVKKGIKIDGLNGTGKTSLMSACESGSIDSSIVLIDNNASLDIRDNIGKSCFDYAQDFATKTKDHQLTTLLLESALERDTPTSQGKTSRPNKF